MERQTKVSHHYSTAYHSQQGRRSSRDKQLQTGPRRIPCLCTSQFVPPVVSSLSLSNLVCGAVQPDNGKQDLPQVGTPNLLTPRERPALTKRGMSMCFPHQGGTWEPPNNHSFPGLCFILEISFACQKSTLKNVLSLSSKTHFIDCLFISRSLFQFL